MQKHGRRRLGAGPPVRSVRLRDSGTTLIGWSRIADLLGFGSNTAVTQNGNTSPNLSVLRSCPCRVDLYSVLTSEIRRATNTREICNCATLLNSGDPATLLPGTRHAPVKSVDVL